MCSSHCGHFAALGTGPRRNRRAFLDRRRWHGACVPLFLQALRAADRNANASDAWWPGSWDELLARWIAPRAGRNRYPNDGRSERMKTWVTLTAAMLTATGLMGLTSAIAGPPPPPPRTQGTDELSGPVNGDGGVRAGAAR